MMCWGGWDVFAHVPLNAERKGDRVGMREEGARREGGPAQGSLLTWSALGIPGVQSRDGEVPLPATRPGLETRPCRHVPAGVHSSTGAQQPKSGNRLASVMGQMDEAAVAGPYDGVPSGHKCHAALTMLCQGNKPTRRATCSIIPFT